MGGLKTLPGGIRIVSLQQTTPLLFEKYWWNPGLTEAAGHFDSCSPSNPARGMAPFALRWGGGELCGGRVRCSFPRPDGEGTRGPGPCGGSRHLCPSHFPCALRPLLFCPAHPSAAHTPGLWCLQAKCVPSSTINCL